MAKLFLGLDSSTQSLSAVVIDLDRRKVIYEKSLNFDQALPQYKTQNGVLPNRDPLVKHSSPLMWAEALDLLFAANEKGRRRARQNPRHQRQRPAARLGLSQRPRRRRAGEAESAKNRWWKICEAFFRAQTSPIWMDSSTAKECAEIRKKLGGIKSTAARTGSDTFERFTGPQIRKFYKTEPEAYAQTASIALVSSFMASLLAGKIAPIDFGDGAGMNLMDIRKKSGTRTRSKATAPGLKQKLPPLAESGNVIGPVSPYFVKKFGLNPGSASHRLDRATIRQRRRPRPDSQTRPGRHQPRHQRHLFWHDEEMPHRRDTAKAMCSARPPAIT